MTPPRRSTLVVIGTTLVLVAGLALTQPWLLFLDEQVAEPLPVAAAQPGPAPAPDITDSPPADPPVADPPVADPPVADPPVPAAAAEPAPDPTVTDVPSQTPTGPVDLVRGALVSHEHATTGTARILALPDGSRVLRLEGLDTSNGPDLRVWLTDAPVIEGRAGWFVFDDGAYVDLGPLEGNQGDANYEIPAGVDLEALSSVSIWCARFRVSFGAAALA